MSFILDALKKSENERQGQRGLGVADVPMAKDKPRAPVWIWWLLGLLAVNVVVLLAVLLRPASEPESASITAPDARAESATERRPATVPERVAPELAALVDRTRTERQAVVRPDATISSGAEMPMRTATPAPAAETPAAGTPAADAGVEVDGKAGTDESRAAVAQRPDTADGGPDTPQATADAQALTLPTLDELRVRGETGLPDLHLDIHVWAEQARGRFVYVNTVKYREGEDLAEGPRVASIVRDGVVLEQNGRRFLLPRD